MEAGTIAAGKGAGRGDTINTERRGAMSGRLVGIGLGLTVLALGSVCYRAIVDERRRRAGREHDDALATWEEEGGKVPMTVRQAGFFESAPLATM